MKTQQSQLHHLRQAQQRHSQLIKQHFHNFRSAYNKYAAQIKPLPRISYKNSGPQWQAYYQKLTAYQQAQPCEEEKAVAIQEQRPEISMDNAIQESQLVRSRLIEQPSRAEITISNADQENSKRFDSLSKPHISSQQNSLLSEKAYLDYSRQIKQLQGIKEQQEEFLYKEQVQLDPPKQKLVVKNDSLEPIKVRQYEDEDLKPPKMKSDEEEGEKQAIKADFSQEKSLSNCVHSLDAKEKPDYWQRKIERGYRCIKYAQGGLWPRQKVIYLDPTHSKLIWRAVDSTDQSKFVMLCDLQSIELGRNSAGFKKYDKGRIESQLQSRSMTLHTQNRIVQLEMLSTKDREELVQSLSILHPQSL